MGSGASVEQEEKGEYNQHYANNIFVDEGVGIEQSQLSRKWTTKMTMFKNLETKQFLDSHFQKSVPKPTIKIEQKPSMVYSSDSDQISKSSSPSEVKQQSPIRNNILSQKKKYTTNSESEEDSDIEEKQLHTERRQTKFQQNLSDDSFEQNDEPTSILKQRFQQIKESISRTSSIDSKNDQQFLSMIEIEEIADDLHLVKQNLPSRYPLSNLLISTIQSEQKVQVGKDKLVRLACRQKFQIMEDAFKNDSVKQSKQSMKQSIMKQSILKSSIRQSDSDESRNEQQQNDYSPEQLLGQIGISITSKKGNKNDGPHTSDYMVYSDDYQKIIILCNGHGEFGSSISNLVYKMVFHYLIQTPCFYANPMRGLENVFKKLQNKLKYYIDKKKLDDTHNLLLSGCVITVAVQRDSKIYFAQIGDNRAYVYKESTHKGKQKKFIVEILPFHYPSDNQEKSRIFNSGGEIRKNPQQEEYVYVRGRLYPQLHVTRSLGDIIGHVIGVSSQPFFREYDITDQDTFLILSTSHAFSYQEYQDIINHLSGFTIKDIKQGCESLYKYDNYINVVGLSKRYKMNIFNLKKHKNLSPIKNFSYLCDNDQLEQAQQYQQQKFGIRSPKIQLPIPTEQIQSITQTQETQLEKVEIIPRSQLIYQKIVLTNSYATLFTFTTFTITFGNYIRSLNFDETLQLCLMESIQTINKFILEKLQQKQNIEIPIENIQNSFQKYDIPKDSYIYISELGLIEIQYPKMEAYFQDSTQSQIISLSNQDVIHLIENKFQTIQQYCQRIHFSKQRTIIRLGNIERIKQIGVDIYNDCTQRQILIKPSKNQKNLENKCIKQICEFDQKYYIIYFIPPQFILKQLKKTMVIQSLKLKEFIQLCCKLEKIHINQFLSNLKLLPRNNNQDFDLQYDLQDYLNVDEVTQLCVQNGLLDKVHRSISYEFNYFQVQYQPPQLIIYDQIRTEMNNYPLDLSIIEQLKMLNLQIEFVIY